MTAGDVRQGRQIEWTGLHLDRERDRMAARQKVDTEELTGSQIIKRDGEEE